MKTSSPQRICLSANYLICTFFILSSCSNPVGEHHPEWKKYFDDYHVNGCIEIFDLKTSKFIDYNTDRCSQRFIPASTFKIPNSLIALHTKTIPDTSYVLKWDSVVHEIPLWNHDQSMNEAFHNSTVWYYQEISRQIGQEKYGQYLNVFHYGNRNPSGKVDSFWLNGALKISSDEQIEFLKNLYEEQLPVSQRSQQLVKGMMLMESNLTYKLFGKTGWAEVRDSSVLLKSTNETSVVQIPIVNIGWFVGWVEKNEDIYFFALNIQSPQTAPENFAEARKNITRSCLKDLKIIPE